MISRIQAAALLLVWACRLGLASDELKPAAGDLKPAASEDSKPACDAETAGQLWPEAANHDSKLLKKFSRCGELELCTLTKRHYHWQLITVRIGQLRGGSALSKPADCDAPDATREATPAAGRASSPPR
jgi:hypothetical protein